MTRELGAVGRTKSVERMWPSISNSKSEEVYA